MTQKSPHECGQDAPTSEDKGGEATTTPEFETQPYPEPPPGISQEIWKLLRGMADALDQCLDGYWSAERDSEIALDHFREWERKTRARE